MRGGEQHGRRGFKGLIMRRTEIRVVHVGRDTPGPIPGGRVQRRVQLGEGQRRVEGRGSTFVPTNGGWEQSRTNWDIFTGPGCGARIMR